MASTALPNSFTGANLSFSNGGIHALIGEVITFRKQLTVREEFKEQSGWNNQLNTYMQDGLLQLDGTVRRISYNPTPGDTAAAAGKPDGAAQLAAQEAEVIDTTKSLDQRYNASSLRSDETLMPSVASRPIVHQLDGSDLNIPQLTPETYANDSGRLFVAGLDQFLVMATRLDSRFDPKFITKNESLMLSGQLEALWAITKEKGGEANRVKTPTGTLPADEAKTLGGGAALAK